MNIKQFLPKKTSFKGLYFNQVGIQQPGEDGFIKIVPIGKFPVHPNGAHEILPRHIEEMAKNFNNSKKDLLFDFDHESLWGNTKAAGWSSEVEAREDGLYVKYPEFTPAAQQAIQNREYRYFSPVYRLNSLSKNGSEIGAQLISVALTNMPYMDNEIDHIGNSDQSFQNNEGDETMLNKDTLALLGLPENASAEQIEQAVKAQAEKVNSLNSELQTIKQQAEEQKTALEQRLEQIEQKVNSQQEQEAEQLIENAIADGKILPADKEVWLNAAKADLEGTRQKLAERKKNSAMPGKLEVPQDPEDDKKKQPDVMANAIEYMKKQGRVPLAQQQNSN